MLMVRSRDLVLMHQRPSVVASGICMHTVYIWPRQK